MNKARLNKRALILFYMLFSAAILPVSGFLLHDSISHNSEHIKFITMAFHNVAAIVFTVSALFHIKLVWKPITNYVRSNSGFLVKYPREMLIACSTLSFLLILAILHVTQSHW